MLIVFRQDIKNVKHSSWIELSTLAFNHNISQFRTFVPSGVKLSIVLKSNAYGHGLLPMGQLCEANSSIDYVCVFFLSEALTLRCHGMTKPILVLGLLDDSIELAIEHNIDVVCFDRSQLNDFHNAAQKAGKKLFVHLKIDTGLSRLGFFPDQVLSVVQDIVTNYPGIYIKGIMTHFSESGALDVQWTERQERVFTEVIALLQSKNINIDMMHASNTGATLRFLGSHFNMVRVGGGSYGLPQRTYVYDLIKKAVPDFELKQVLTYKSRIMSIKELPAGSFISYDRLYQTPRPQRLALAPIGYSDGFGRRKPAGLHVLINGVLAPVVGSVCMNMTIIDISHISNVEVNDEVTAIGDHEGIRVNDIAPLVGCVNYEVTTLLNPATKRMIVK